LQKNWWVVFFVLLCYGLYEKSTQKIDQESETLQEQLLELQVKMQSVSAEIENLKLQINSQSDPDWVEIVLMKELGVVPEGYKKLVFSKKP